MFKHFDLFTKEGIELLTNLKNSLTKLLAKEYETENGSSSYSKEMVSNVIDVIDEFLRHNDLDYWKKEKNRNNLAEKLDLLDGGKGTYVPEIFNEQSLDLAETLLAALKKISLNNIISLSIQNALTAAQIDPNKLFTLLKDNLQKKVSFYKILVTNEENVIKQQEKLNNVTQTFKKFEEQAQKLSESSLAQDKTNFITDYNTQIASLIEEINKLPYVRVCNAGNFVNQAKPYQIDHSTFATQGNRGLLIQNLLHSESNLNKTKLHSLQLSVSVVYDCFKNKFDLEKYKLSQNKLAEIIAALIIEIKPYMSGKHLPLFLKPNIKKQEVMIELLDNINKKLLEELSIIEEKKKHIESISDSAKKLYQKIEDNLALLFNSSNAQYSINIGIFAIEMFKIMLNAIAENEKVSQEEKISIGQLSKLLYQHGRKFFDLSFFEIDESCDVGIKEALARYEEVLNINSGNLNKMEM